MNIVKDAKRIVVKIGSSTLTHENFRMNLRRIEALTRVLSEFKNAGKEIVLVSSGAISAGVAKMGLSERPKATEEKQALAAVGQSELMRIYEHFFSMFGHPVAQMLLTKDIMENVTARKNAENTFSTLLKMGCIPIVNENDSVSFDEIEFGDNDTLSAYISVLCHSDCLIILSDIDGLYDSDPHKNSEARLISTVAKIDSKILGYAGGAGSNRGTGGLITKLHAAEIVTSEGIPMFIVNGQNPEILYDLFEGKHVGTYFMSGN
ncbi:MAG: glutamate 5-kinase [Clostridia bacterium]|nr:glutamate 5-kinase [Clostridia bacterium]